MGAIPASMISIIVNNYSRNDSFAIRHLHFSVATLDLYPDRRSKRKTIVIRKPCNGIRDYFAGNLL